MKNSSIIVHARIIPSSWLHIIMDNIIIYTQCAAQQQYCEYVKKLCVFVRFDIVVRFDYFNYKDISKTMTRFSNGN